MSAPQIPPHVGETDDERRLRECINRHAQELMTAVDAALRLRVASSPVSRHRSIARRHLEDFGIAALHAIRIRDSVDESPTGEDP